MTPFSAISNCFFKSSTTELADFTALTLATTTSFAFSI